MPDSVESLVLDSLVLDLLEWVGATPRPYAEVLDAWRTSCPRLPVWEAANQRGYVVRQRPCAAGEVLISLSPAGAAHLRAHRPALTAATTSG